MRPQLRHMVDVIYFNLYRGRFVPDSLLGPSNGCLAKSLLKVGLMPIVAGCRLVVLEQDWAQPALDVDLMSMSYVASHALNTRRSSPSSKTDDTSFVCHIFRDGMAVDPFLSHHSTVVTPTNHFLTV